MKPTHNSRVIALCSALALVIALAGIAVWRVSTSVREPEDSPVEPVNTLEADKIYTEVMMKELPEGTNDLLLYGDQVVARTGTGNSMTIADADTWETLFALPPEWEENGQLLSQIAFDDEKNIYGAVYLPPTGEVQIKKRYHASSKQDETVTLQGYRPAKYSDGKPQIDKLKVDSDYIYLLSTKESDAYSGIQVFTQDGAPYMELDNIVDFDIDGQGGLYGIPKPNTHTEVRRWDMKTKGSVYTFAASEILGAAWTQTLALQKSEGILCLGTSSSVLAYQMEDGAFVDVRMDMVESAPTLVQYINRMVIDKEGNIYFMLYTGEEGGNTVRFYKFAFRDNPRKDLPYTLTVSALYRDEFMARVIAQFEKENPTQKIYYNFTYNSYMEAGKNMVADGYLDKINLQLMTGEAGDIVMTGGTWFDTYQLSTAGIFEDLKPLVEKDPAYQELDKKMLDAVTIDGAIQCLPLAGNYYYAEINQSLCDELGIDLDWNTATWSDVLGLVDRLQGTDKYLFAMYDNGIGTDTIGSSSMQRDFVRMLISNMPDLIDRGAKTVDLHKPWFEDLIESWKQAAQSPNFAQINDRIGLTEDALICVDLSTEQSIESDLWQDASRFKSEAGKDMLVCPLFSGEKNSNRTAYSADMYSIPASSKNKEAAWALLSRAIQSDLQGQDTLRNRPLNAKARNAKIQKAVDANIESDNEMAGNIQAFYRELQAVYQSVDTLYDMNKIKEDLFPPLLKYFDGNSTLDEALEQAEHNIWIRINE